MDIGLSGLVLDRLLWVCGGAAVLAVFGGGLYWIARRRR
jgi:hypothetical protein